MNKEEKLQITKDKLIDATYQLMMETEDPLTVTSRQIAARADVKPSMINYCFESRENLIYQVFNRRFLNLMEGDNVSSSGIISLRVPLQDTFCSSVIWARNHSAIPMSSGIITAPGQRRSAGSSPMNSPP